MFAYRLYTFFQRRRVLLSGIIVALFTVFAYFSTKVELEEDITRFLPKDKNTENINFILQSLKTQDKLILNLYHKDTSTTNTEALAGYAEQLADTLLKTHSDYIKDLNYKVSDELMMQTYSTFYSNLPIFLDEKDYEKITGWLKEDSIQKILSTNYRTLLSPSGIALGRYIRRDPLNFTPLALKKMQDLQFDENFELSEGYILTKDKKNLFLFITPKVGPNETNANRKFLTALDGIIEHLTKASGGNLNIEYYGAPAVATGNAIQVRHDSLLTSGIALTVIILILLLFFRRVLIIFYILLPVAFGALFSLTLVYFIKEEISTIALGAGSIILGIAINYSLHFFTHYKHERSVKKVVEDLTLPMLIGCTTTVGAFLSLQFAKSQALHDFGMFAGFSLIGALLFSIVVLPHLLKTKHEQPAASEHANSLLQKLLAYPLDKNKFIVLPAFALTIVFAFTARNVGFESDMMKMNYQSEKLTAAQANLERINKYSLSSVYVISKGENLDKALQVNERINAKLAELKAQNLVGKYSSVSSVLVSDSLQQLRIARWNAFWKEGKKDSLKSRLIRYGQAYKFKENAFEEFFGLLNKDFRPVSQSRLDSLKQLVASGWISETSGQATIINMVKAEPDLRPKLYEAFQNDAQVLVFDRTYMTNRFVEIISSDFNRILMITALLVFGFMLLSHGRIELAIINFLPMFISWLWILGIMGLAGLKFNIINIIISTFIFGLGDDYSIFILDGLSHEYKYGRKNIDSYKASIFLSAITNIVGVGVLIFAEHPALKSIAAITIIGMCTVLFISFTVQPVLYNFMILNRKKRGLLPYTFLNIFITGVGFVIFICFSLLATLCGLVLFYLVPGFKQKRKLIFHYMIMYTCRLMVYMVANVPKRIVNPHTEKFDTPSIIISNHQSYIDLALVLMLHPRIVVFTNDTVWHSPLYGLIVRMADFYQASQGYENALDKMKELTSEGYSVLIFPEGTRSTSGEILRFHKGAFYLAEKLNLDLVPLLLHGAGEVVPKGDFHFKEGKVTLKYLPRIKPTDTQFGEGYKNRAKKIREYMRDEFNALRAEKETVDYFRPKLIKNYIYKGPVLEWYCRIKVKLEDNYRGFESYLPKTGHLVDVGCGYGFLSLMLGFMGRDRKITGIDYDEDKISVAANCISKNENTEFIHADVTQHEFTQADAFIINDVLHYLAPDQQAQLIGRCVSKLNPGGVMIIRDADADMKQRHRGTRYTEFFSTNSGFNKTKEDGLHFTSASRIKTALDAFNFITYELIDDTKLTSNVTFVVRHTGKKQWD